MSGESPRSYCAISRTDHFVFAPVRGRNRAKTCELVQGAASGISLGMQTNERIRLLVTDAALAGWLGQAEPGDVLEYYQGFLVLDTSPMAKRLSDADRTALVKVARRALWAAEHDLVHLVQRRLGTEAFAYLAIARPRPRKGIASLSTLLAAEAA